MRLLAMASLAETRDSDTGNHIRRTQYYVKVLAQQLRHHPKYAAILDDAMINLLYKSAPLHDIGNVGIPDSILLKPGRFVGNEFEIMKTHTTLGWNAIEYAEKALGAPVEFLRLAKEIALYHQEKWDGSGYPEGLAGEAIPLSARLMACSTAIIESLDPSVATRMRLYMACSFKVVVRTRRVARAAVLWLTWIKPMKQDPDYAQAMNKAAKPADPQGRAPPVMPCTWANSRSAMCPHTRSHNW